MMRTLLTLLLIGSTMFSLSAKNLVAYFNYNKFYAPEQGPYLESYLTIVGESVEFAQVESGYYQANVEVTLLLRQDGEIVDFKKYNLTSPEVAAGGFTDFVDQQRFALKEGTYELEIEMLDLNLPDAKPFSASQTLEIAFPSGEIALSDIQLLKSYKKATEPSTFTKSGFDLLPVANAYFDEQATELAFYAEVYNTDQVLGQDMGYLVNYYIETFDKERTLGNFFRFDKTKASPVNPVLHKFDITELGSGYYNLVVEVRDKENVLIRNQKIFFQRLREEMGMSMESLASADVTNTFVALYSEADTLREHIFSLHPIASDLEKQIIDRQIATAELQTMQQFFYSFWYNRNTTDPKSEWEIYEAEVEKVEKLFGTRNKHGYQTDQGRVYLQYGAPNTITNRPNEPSAYPYQIWHYYKVGKFNNKRFVYYSEQLVATEYTLLHSEIPGEPKDYRWQFRIQKRQNEGGNIDDPNGTNHYGGRTDDLFSLPR